MTDAREIIAQEFRRAHRDTCYPDATTGECEIAASAIVAALEAAGIRFAGPEDRIIGPDEVDQVTLEKAAEAAEEQAEWVPLKADDMRAAILAIGRKA